MANMVTKVVGELQIVIHTAEAPDATEWKAYMRDFMSVPPERLRTIVFTDGGGPNAPQRKDVNDYLKGRTTTAAIVTPSTMTRGVVTALAWFNPKIRAFAPDRIDEAFKYLGFGSKEIQTLWAEVHAMRVMLGHDDLKAIPKPLSAR